MKTLVVIGGSKGVGFEIVKSSLETYYVISISRSKSNLYHPNLTQIECDILVDELPIIREVNMLVYCIGTINLKPFNKLKLSDFNTEFDVNVVGAIKVIQFYLPQLKISNLPSILLFSSVAAKIGMPFHSSISVSKSALEGLVKSLAAEFAPLIRVNAISPTIIDTTLAQHLLRNAQSQENMIQRHPLKKYLNAKEVADMALFLLSEKSASISGQIIEMDCGLSNLKI